MRLLVAATLSLGLISACTESNQQSGSQIIPQAAAEVGTPAQIHQGLMVFDSHLDTPAYFHNPTYDFSKRGSFEVDGTHVDLPRMNEGGLDGGFWVIYTNPGPLTESAYAVARHSALMRMTAIREFAAKYHEEVELAFTADDADRIMEEGKKVVFQSIENAYPIGTDLSLLETFYIGGVRMIGPVHFANSQFADSATDIWRLKPAWRRTCARGQPARHDSGRLSRLR